MVAIFVSDDETLDRTKDLDVEHLLVFQRLDAKTLPDHCVVAECIGRFPKHGS